MFHVKEKQSNKIVLSVVCCDDVNVLHMLQSVFFVSLLAYTLGVILYHDKRIQRTLFTCLQKCMYSFVCVLLVKSQSVFLYIQGVIVYDD